MRNFNWKNLLLGAIVVAVTLLVIFVLNATAEEIVIQGYQTGEYAVKGQVKESLDGIVSQLAGKQVVITVAGSADTADKSTVNDELAAKRAEHARAYLAGKLPLANVKAPWSEGDSANARQVKVVYTITPELVLAPVAPLLPVTNEANSDLSAATIILAAVSTGFFVILVPFAIILLLARRRRNQAKAEEEKVVTSLEIKDVEVDNAAGAYMVKLTKKSDGKWHTPFATLEDSTKPLFRADFQSAKKAVRGCVKDSRYADQFKRLLAAGEEIKKK